MGSVDCWNCPVRKHTIYRGIGEGQSGAIYQARQRLVTYKRGQMIVHGEKSPDHVFTLISGWAYSYVFLADGRRQILRYFHPGHLISLSDLTPGGPVVSTRALTDVEMCQFDKTRLLDLLEQNRSTVRGMLAYLNGRRNMAELRMIQLGAMNAEEATASLILEFFHKARSRSPCEREFVFPLRLSDIAETLGITAVHAGRIIRGLEKKKAIWRKGRQHLGIDEELLRSIIGGAETWFSREHVDQG